MFVTVVFFIPRLGLLTFQFTPLKQCITLRKNSGGLEQKLGEGFSPLAP